MSAPNPQPPYRTRPRTAPGGSLRKLNRDMGLFGPSVYLPAAEEIAAMAGASRSTSLEPDLALERWLTHPDERVPIALLAHHSELLWPHRDLPIALYRRAIREADAAGEVWSPLLDVLEVRGWWPMQPGACVLRFDAYNRRLPGCSAREDPVQPAVRLQELAGWLSAQKDARRLLPLRAFVSNPLRDRVASSAGVLDRTVMESLLPDPRHWFELAQNPKFGPDALQFIEGSLRTWFDSDHDSAWVVAAAAALERLDRERGIHVRLDLVRRSIQAIPSLTEASRLLPDPKLEQWYLWMARSPGLSPEDLDLVIDATDHQPGQRRVLFEMVSHGASTGPTTWARLAREFGHVKGLRMALAEHPVASRTPEVRSVLLGSSDPGVVRALAPTLSRAELRAVWERRGKPALRPSLLLELLEGVSEEVRAELGRRDLLPLMRAADESVRLKAIRISGRLLGYAA